MLLLEGDATITVALASVIAHVVTIFLVIMFVGGGGIVYRMFASWG